MTQTMSNQKPQLWKTKKLSLAAYAKVFGAELKDVSGREFTLSSETPKSEWETRFVNSESSRFNNELIGLNELRRG